MGKISATALWGKHLVNKVTCPNCWHAFFPEESLFVAKHPDLIGDTVAGPNEYLRFLPERFAPGGEAIDPKGFETTEMACPRATCISPRRCWRCRPFSFRSSDRPPAASPTSSRR